MKKVIFFSFVAFAALHGADMSNKSLIKNRASHAKDNGGVYANQMYIYENTAEVQREINAQSRNKNTPISVISPTVVRDDRVRAVNVLVEGGNLNVIGRKADVNIVSPNIAANSGVKEINVATDINNINILANKNNTVNIAAPTVASGNQLVAVNISGNVGNINTAANQNMTANMSSVNASSVSAPTVKNISTNVTVGGAVRVNNGTTLNVGTVNIGAPKTDSLPAQSRTLSDAYEVRSLSELPVLTNINTSSGRSGMAYTGKDTTNDGVDSRTGQWIGNGVSNEIVANTASNDKLFDSLSEFAKRFVKKQLDAMVARNLINEVVWQLEKRGLISSSDGFAVSLAKQVMEDTSVLGVLRSKFKNPLHLETMLACALLDFIAKKESDRLGGMSNPSGAAVYFGIREIEVLYCSTRYGVGGAVVMQAILAAQDIHTAYNLYSELSNIRKNNKLKEKENAVMAQVSKLREEYIKSLDTEDEKRAWNRINNLLVDLYANPETGVVGSKEKQFIKNYLNRMEEAKKNRDTLTETLIRTGVATRGANRVQFKNFVSNNYKEAQAAYWLTKYDAELNKNR